MTDKSHILLHDYVHKTLVRRLLLMTLAIAMLVSAIIYLLERHRMNDYVVEVANNAVQLILARTGSIMEEKGIDRFAAFRQAFSEYLAAPGEQQSGTFVYAGFFKPNGDLIDEYIEKQPGNELALKRHFLTKPLIKPGIDTHHITSETRDGRVYIYLVFPILEANRKVAAYTHTVFALSDATQQQIQQTIWQAVVATGLIILATSVLLYPVILRMLKHLSRFAMDLLNANLQSISLLGSAIAKRDSDTDAHNYRVSIYSVRLAEAVGLEVEAIRRLIKGAFLHDVGKIAIRDVILLKPGKLDESEFEVMKTHVEHGLDIVARSNWLTDAKDVVGSHHEKYSGKGYPKGLSGREIPITARIFAIADVFDALTSKRPYKDPMSFEESMAILHEGSGSHFDPGLLAVFDEISADLYKKYSGREDQGLHDELGEILRQYFSADVQSLMP